MWILIGIGIWIGLAILFDFLWKKTPGLGSSMVGWEDDTTR